MRRLYLGDALDFWKGAMLDILRESTGRTRAVKILPMLTDDKRWSDKELRTYVGLLGGAGLSDVLLREPIRGPRVAYFTDARERMSEGDDVFVDPDTGMGTKKATRRHITARELMKLLSPSKSTVVAVYQHAPRQRPGWLNGYRRRIKREPVLRIVGYEGTQVGMLFVTRSPERAKSLDRALSHRLGVAAAGRMLRN